VSARGEGVSIYMGRTAVELGKSWTTRPGAQRSDVDSIATVRASQGLLPASNASKRWFRLQKCFVLVGGPYSLVGYFQIA
jgi:hypothetical protein